jgi:aldose 1-epimerase
VTGESGVLKKIAIAHEPATGRELTIFSTEPGVQFYTGNFLTGVKGKQSIIYPKRYGFCLETQHFPDSPNKPEFPTVILNPGERFQTETIYKFSVR